MVKSIEAIALTVFLILLTVSGLILIFSFSKPLSYFDSKESETAGYSIDSGELMVSAKNKEESYFVEEIDDNPYKIKDVFYSGSGSNKKSSDNDDNDEDSPECYENPDCGTDGFISTECNDSDVYGVYRTWTCENPGEDNAECTYSDTYIQEQDCGESYCDLEINICKDDDVYSSTTCYNKGCFDGACFGDVFSEEEKLEECGLAGCENGACKTTEIACYENPDCGTDLWTALFGCLDENSLSREWISWTCENPGTLDSSCTSLSEFLFWESCGEDVYSENYCYDGGVYYNYTDNGCSAGSCFSDTIQEKVQECGLAGCDDTTNACKTTEIACYENPDCGTNSIIQELCQDDDVYSVYRTWTCENPGEDNAECTYSDTYIQEQDCGTDIYTENYCYDGDVYYNYTDNGCSAGSCFSDTIQEKVEECGLAGCDDTTNACKTTEIIEDNLNKGLNLFSLPLIPSSDKNTFNELDTNCEIETGGPTCSGYNLAYYDTQEEEYVCVGLNDELYAGQGYMIKVKDDCYINYEGQEFSALDSIIGFLGTGNLYAGFNLIGAPSNPVNINNIKGDCTILSWPRKYVEGVSSCINVNDYNDGYESCGENSAGVLYCDCEVSNLIPGYGYWIETENNCKLS